MTAKNRRSLSIAGRSELQARAAAFDYLTKSLDRLQPTDDPQVMYTIARTFSMMTTAQMKVRQVKGKEEDDEDDDKEPNTVKGLSSLLDAMKPNQEHGEIPL